MEGVFVTIFCVFLGFAYSNGNNFYLQYRAIDFRQVDSQYQYFKNFFFLQRGYNVDFIVLCRANKSIFRSRSRINFIRVVVILALLGYQTSHSQNKFFLFLVAQYTIS